MAKKPSNKRKVTIKRHMDQNDGHPHVILDDIGNKHVSVGLTSQPKKGKGKNAGTNYRLENNPLGGASTKFMRRQGTVDDKKKYSGKRNGLMTEKDYAQAQK